MHPLGRELYQTGPSATTGHAEVARQQDGPFGRANCRLYMPGLCRLYMPGLCRLYMQGLK